jgi:hypothetical protein
MSTIRKRTIIEVKARSKEVQRRVTTEMEPVLETG